MKLFKYNQFIKESNPQWDNNQLDKELLDELNNLIEIGRTPLNVAKIQDLRLSFKEHLNNVIDDMNTTSYSGLARGNGNPNEDFESIQDKLDERGFNLGYIKKLFSKEVDDLLNQNFERFVSSYDLYGCLIEKDGLHDIYLYKLNKLLDLNYEVDLGGEGWASYILHPDNEDCGPGYELLIKYAYGFHNTNYGKLLLSQVGYNNVDNFVEDAFLQLKRNLIDHILYKLRKKYNLIMSSDRYFRFESLLDETFIEEDNSLIFQIENFYDSLIKDGMKEKEYEESKEELIKIIKERCSDLFNSAFNIELGVDNLIIR
jgi:hypothetical protein